MPQILLLKLPMEEKTQQASKQKMDTERFFLFAVETQEWMLVWGEGAKASPPSREKCQKVRGSPAARDRASAFRRDIVNFPGPRPPCLPHASPRAGRRTRCRCCAVRSRAEEPWSQSRECVLTTFYSLCLGSKAAFPLAFSLGAAASGHACALPLHKPRSFWIFP